MCQANGKKRENRRIFLSAKLFRNVVAAKILISFSRMTKLQKQLSLLSK